MKIKCSQCNKKRKTGFDKKWAETYEKFEYQAIGGRIKKYICINCQIENRS